MVTNNSPGLATLALTPTRFCTRFAQLATTCGVSHGLCPRTRIQQPTCLLLLGYPIPRYHNSEGQSGPEVNVFLENASVQPQPTSIGSSCQSVSLHLLFHPFNVGKHGAGTTALEASRLKGHTHKTPTAFGAKESHTPRAARLNDHPATPHRHKKQPLTLGLSTHDDERRGRERSPHLVNTQREAPHIHRNLGVCTPETLNFA